MYLLEKSVFENIQAAYKTNLVDSLNRSDVSCLTDIMSVNNETAQINIKGILTHEPDFFASMFGSGNTLYSDISESLVEANNNPNISKISLVIDSPGGSYDGLFRLVDSIKSIQKPIEAIIINMCASAAYAIASQADTIVATNRSNRIGSIGVVQTHFLMDHIIEITNTDSPNKRPDLSTQEGRDVIVTELNQMHNLFTDSVSKGRNVSVNEVNTNFGQGAIFLAEKALQNKMIDSIKPLSLNLVSNTNMNHNLNYSENLTMDLKELKREHSNLYDTVLKEGVDSERDRVVAHITLGEQCGDINLATKAIRDGSQLNSTMLAEYTGAGIKKNMQSLRKMDEADINDISNNDNLSDPKCLEDKTVALVVKLCDTGKSKKKGANNHA